MIVIGIWNWGCDEEEVGVCFVCIGQECVYCVYVVFLFNEVFGGGGLQLKLGCVVVNCVNGNCIVCVDGVFLWYFCFGSVGVMWWIGCLGFGWSYGGRWLIVGCYGVCFVVFGGC